MDGPLDFTWGYTWAATMLAILRHSSAHRRHASAHRWQCASGNRAHSAAQASQMLAHRLQIWFTNWLPLAIHWTAIVQMSAQSRRTWMQRLRALASGACRQAVAQCSHSRAHCWHAATQELYCSCTGFTPFPW